MSDLVKRLRGEGCHSRKPSDTVRLMEEAADEIERLEKKLLVADVEYVTAAVVAKKELLDDLREWASQNTRNGNLAGTEFVNAYEKGRLK